MSGGDDVLCPDGNHRLAGVDEAGGLREPIDDGARAGDTIFGTVQGTLDKVRRAQLGDMAATRALVDELQQPIVALAKVCVSLGWPLAEVLEAFAAALAVAIETFDEESPRTFVDHTMECLARAIHAGGHQSAPAPN